MKLTLLFDTLNLSVIHLREIEITDRALKSSKFRQHLLLETLEPVAPDVPV